MVQTTTSDWKLNICESKNGKRGPCLVILSRSLHHGNGLKEHNPGALKLLNGTLELYVFLNRLDALISELDVQPTHVERASEIGQPPTQGDI